MVQAAAIQHFQPLPLRVGAAALQKARPRLIIRMLAQQVVLVAAEQGVPVALVERAIHHLHRHLKVTTGVRAML